MALTFHSIKDYDLFDPSNDMVVCTINCVGSMGKGVALACKQRSPDLFFDYTYRCRYNKVQPGAFYTCTAKDKVLGKERTFIMAATKDHWRHPSKYEWIEGILSQLSLSGFTGKIAMPPLGCGNGGLNWSVVKAMMQEILKDLPADYHVIS